MSSQPNVVILFTDDQRFDTIQALGNSTIHTPNIDRLVNGGTSFTQAHIPGGTSAAVCMPSRAMLNTGRSLFHIESAGRSIPREHTTMGEAFRNQGYSTFATGKWHNGTDAYHRSFTDGGEIFFGGMADHWNVPSHNFDPTGKYESQLPYCVDPVRSREIKYFNNADHIHAGCHSSETIVDRTVDFIDNYNNNSPFFLYVSFLAPHDPRTMPDKFRAMYAAEDMTLPPNFMGGHPFNNGELHIRDEMLAEFPRLPEEIRGHLADYYAMITHLDYQVGRVLDTLEKKGELDNTIIVFAGDNGLALGQHGLMGKQSLYDHSVRVPLIFSGPGIPQGERREAFAYLFDIFPTLCNLTGIPCPESVEGMNLTPVIRDNDTPGREALYFAYCEKHRGVRVGDFKLIEYVVQEEHNMTQLFNLREDPWELHNLAIDEKYTGKVAEMRTRLKELRDEWEDCKTNWGETFWKAITF